MSCRWCLDARTSVPLTSSDTSCHGCQPQIHPQHYGMRQENGRPYNSFSSRTIPAPGPVAESETEPEKRRKKGAANVYTPSHPFMKQNDVADHVLAANVAGAVGAAGGGPGGDGCCCGLGSAVFCCCGSCNGDGCCSGAVCGDLGGCCTSVLQAPLMCIAGALRCLGRCFFDTVNDCLPCS